MNNEVKETEGKTVRFKIGQQDFIGYVDSVNVDEDYLIMLVNNNTGQTKVTIRIDAIDAILQFID